MAVDTALKRYSVVHLGSPARGPLPLPDAAITLRDRQMLVGLYSGIVVTGGSSAGTGSPGTGVLLRRRRR